MTHSKLPNSQLSDRSQAGYGLTTALLDEVLPFHLVLDRQLSVIQAGRSILRICPSLKVGQPFHNALTFDRPLIKEDFSEITSNSSKIFLLESQDVEGLFFKGQFLLGDDGEHLIFAGAPWLHAESRLSQNGLKLSDFALHDSAADFLLLLNSNQATLRDTEALAERLRQEKEWTEVTLGSIGDGVIAVDTEGTISYMNPVAEEMTGFIYSDAEGLGLEQVMHLVDETTRHSKEDFLGRALQRCAATVLPPTILLTNAIDGRQRQIEGKLTPIKNQKQSVIGMVVVFHDVTDRQRLMHQLEHQSTHDHLTGLPNRLLLMDRLDQVIGQARRNRQQAAVLFLDLDRFKNINDSLGHQIGDQLLKQVAERLKMSVRETDTVCRLGGDEFVVLLSNVDGEQVSRLAEKTLLILKKPFEISSYKLNVSSSIGISCFPVDADDANRLLKNADLAMYAAKKDAPGCYRFFSSTMDQWVSWRMSLENSLHDAIENDELSLHYQPKVGPENGCVTGYEALLRWTSDVHGEVAPNRFIPIAEETGLILPIGEWVINEACRQLSEWSGAVDEDFILAINVSLIQLMQGDLEKVLVDALHRHQVRPENLELEFTESILVRNFESTLPVLERLKQLGFKLAIDDFGIGYSSLNYLRHFPIDTLKIDRSFIGGICENDDTDAIVQAIISLSHSLRINVVAEGCETEEQFNFLKQTGCNQLQGYLISRPLTVEELSPFLQPDYKFVLND